MYAKSSLKKDSQLLKFLQVFLLFFISFTALSEISSSKWSNKDIVSRNTFEIESIYFEINYL